MAELQPIHSEQDYETALDEIEGLMNAKPGTGEGDRLEMLATLVQAYEAEHHAIERSDHGARP